MFGELRYIQSPWSRDILRRHVIGQHWLQLHFNRRISHGSGAMVSIKGRLVFLLVKARVEGVTVEAVAVEESSSWNILLGLWPCSVVPEIIRVLSRLRACRRTG